MKKLEPGCRVEVTDRGTVVLGTNLRVLHSNDPGNALWLVKLDSGVYAAVPDRALRRVDIC